MQVYKAPLKDMKFLLRDFLNSESSDILFNKLEIDPSDLEMVLELANKRLVEINCAAISTPITIMII